jgi:hypothetical protein
MNDHSSTVQHNTSPFTKKNKDEIAMFNIVLVVQKKVRHTTNIGIDEIS